MTTFGEYKKQDAKVSPESPEFIWDGRKPRLATPEEAATIRATRIAKEETEAFLNPPEAAGPRVGRALARGVTETFKDVGPGEDTRKFLQENAGLFAGIPGGIATIKGVLSGTDIAIKSIIAPFNGVIEGGAQTIKEITGSDTEANRFRRDATALTEIGFLVSSAVPPVVGAASKGVAARKALAKKVGQAAKKKPREVPGFAGNLNLEKMEISPAAKKQLSEIKPDTLPAALKAGSGGREDARFNTARRGIRTNEQTKAAALELADTMGMPYSRAETGLAKQGITNAETITALRLNVVESTNKLVEAARKALGGSDELILDFENKLRNHVTLQEELAGITAEVGRSLQAFKIKVGGEFSLRAAKEAIEGAGGPDKIKGVAEKIVSLADDAGGLNAFARKVTKPKFSDYALEIWLNSLLSGPTTQAVNVLSNTLVAGWTIPEHAIAAGFSKLRGARGADKVYLREASARAFGFVEGGIDGLKLAAHAFRHEESIDPFFKMDIRRQISIPSFRLRKGAQPVTLRPKSNLARRIFGDEVALPFTGEIQIGGKQIRIPGRMLLAGDEFFKSIGRQMEINARAMNEGLTAGLKGRDLAAYIRGAKAEPSEMVALAATDAARYQTFTKPLGPFGNAFLGAANEHPILRIIFPFVRTPANIVKFAGERTPFSVFSKKVRANLLAGTKEGDIQRARVAFGSMVGASVAYLASEGFITGSGPADSAARKMWLVNHKPYSIKVGDQWYAYSRLEPLGILFGLSADFADIAGSWGHAETKDIAGAIAYSISNNITNKTFLRGLAESVGAIREPSRFGERFLANFAGTVIPTGVAQYNRLEDPVLRDTRTEKPGIEGLIQAALNKIKSRTPGYSKDLPALRNLWGEPIVLEGGLGPDIISPIYSSRVRNDKTSQQMLDLDVGVNMPQRRLQGVLLTPQQYAEYVEMAGQPAKKVLDQMVNQPGWERMNPYVRGLLMRRIILQFREAAGQVITARHGLIQKRVGNLKQRIEGK